MHGLLQARGFEFERQYRVERWHIDLVLKPLAFEIERSIGGLPHCLKSSRPDTYGSLKYQRLLTLLDQGWYVMAMYPPYIEGWDTAPDVVIDYLTQIKAGTAPHYVGVQQ